MPAVRARTHIRKEILPSKSLHFLHFLSAPLHVLSLNTFSQEQQQQYLMLLATAEEKKKHARA
jgi:hypothetical protein